MEDKCFNKATAIRAMLAGKECSYASKFFSNPRIISMDDKFNFIENGKEVDINKLGVADWELASKPLFEEGDIVEYVADGLLYKVISVNLGFDGTYYSYKVANGIRDHGCYVSSEYTEKHLKLVGRGVKG